MNIHNITLHLMPCGLNFFWIKSKLYTLWQISFLCDRTGAVFIAMTFPTNQHECLSWGRGNMLAVDVVAASVGGNWGFRANQCVWTEGLQRRAATAVHSLLEHVHPRTHACCQPGALSLSPFTVTTFLSCRQDRERENFNGGLIWALWGVSYGQGDRQREEAPMTIDEKASLFSDLFSMEECLSLAQVLSFTSYVCKSSILCKWARLVRRGAFKPAVPPASNQLFMAHMAACTWIHGWMEILLQFRSLRHAAHLVAQSMIGVAASSLCISCWHLHLLHALQRHHCRTAALNFLCVMLSRLLRHGCLRLLVRDLAGRRHHLLSRFRATTPPTVTSQSLSLACVRMGILWGSDSVLQPQSSKLSENVCADTTPAWRCVKAPSTGECQCL